MSPEEFMKVAIEEAKRSLREGNRGFGAVVVKDGNIIVRAHDTVYSEMDVTAHAEVNAVRMAVKALNSLDLSGCALFATHDPCTMCGSTMLWARISRISIGLSRSDAGIPESGIQLPIENIARGVGFPVKVTRGVLSDECKELHDNWR